MKCNCHSYNADIGAVKEVSVQHRTMGTKCIDACIAPVIQKLWDGGIWTSGCCCGHNGVFGMPSIVLGENEDNYKKIRSLIKEVDDRTFELTQWKRVIV
jgi:hypothetical protein